MNQTLRGAAILAFTLCAMRANAELAWETNRLEFFPSLSQAMVKGSFPFRNIGPSAVKISDVQATCGCTEAAASQSDIPADGTGNINFELDLKYIQGIAKHYILVKTDETGRPPVKLDISISSPMVVVCSPDHLKWDRTTQNAEKEVRIEMKVPGTIRSVSADLAGAGFMIGEIQRRSESVYVAKLRAEFAPATIERLAIFEVIVETGGATKQLRVPLTLILDKSNKKTPGGGGANGK